MAGAVLVWEAVGVSLGWYYTLTYFGGQGWPLPTPEDLGACLMYYFSVLNVRTEIQAIHWIVVFPVAGLLWSGVLTWTAPFAGGRRGDAPRVCLGIALAALPLAAPLPFLTWFAGQVDGRFEFARMMAVALRRGWRMPPDWLSPVVLMLALVGLGVQWWVYRRMLAVPPRRALAHYAGAAAVYFVAVTASAVLVAVPLRACFE